MPLINRIIKTCSSIIYYLSIVGFIIILVNLGFDLNISQAKTLRLFHFIFLLLIFGGYAFRFLITFKLKLTRSQKAWNGIFALISTMLILYFVLMFKAYEHDDLISKIFAYLSICIVFFIELSKRSFNYDWLSINPRILFILSFFTIILLGALLLLLPNCTVNGISFIDSLFTSTSAVCVTGLAVVDTQYAFTQLGQFIIMILIQIGGLGVMTFTSFLGIFFVKRTTFRNQMVLQDFVSSENFNEVFKTVIKIVFATFIIEGIGAVLLFFSIDTSIQMPFGDRVFFSIFHSVSAFCNAGFSTLSQNLAGNEIKFNYPVHLIVAFLIILGGLGFNVFINVYKYLKHYIKNKAKQILFKEPFQHLPWVININTIIVILTTVALLIFGTVMFYIFEYNHILTGHSWYGKIIESFFASVSPRTAGFNTFDFGQLYTYTILIIIFLMWIGASPGSTGGGVKTTTFFVALLNVFCLSQGKDRIEFLRRKISNISVRRAYAVIFLSFIIIGLGSMTISIFDNDKSMLAIIFETVSAYGTVGLSMGITASLTAASKLVIIITMFLGRVGMLTVLIGMFTQIKTLNYQYPKEEVIVT